MAKYALVDSDIVTNIIVCESKELAQQIFPNSLIVEIPEIETPKIEDAHLHTPHIGLKYTLADGFEQPIITPVEDAAVIIPTE